MRPWFWKVVAPPEKSKFGTLLLSGNLWDEIDSGGICKKW